VAECCARERDVQRQRAVWFIFPIDDALARASERKSGCGLAVAVAQSPSKKRFAGQVVAILN